MASEKAVPIMSFHLLTMGRVGAGNLHAEQRREAVGAPVLEAGGEKHTGSGSVSKHVRTVAGIREWGHCVMGPSSAAWQSWKGTVTQQGGVFQAAE